MEAPVTVFRSADESASEDAASVQQMLAEDGIQAELVDDSAPGVPSGVYEVRVAPADQARAEALISEFSPDAELTDVDPSDALDLVAVFHSSDSRMEALAVKSLLESNGVSAFLSGDARLPNLPEEVRVAREQATRAKRLIAAAVAAGPAAADEAEASSENV